MPDRDIRYCTTEDGVSIAYSIEGEGPITILALPVFYESFSLDHLVPVYKQFYRELGAGRRIIRFDWRGTGLSRHVPTGTLISDWRADLAAVALAAGQPCVVWASTIAGIAAVDLTVSHPDFVTHLIFYGTYAAVADAFPEVLLDGFRKLVDADWQMGAQTIADTNGRREYPLEAAQLGDWFYQSVTKETYLAIGDFNQARASQDRYGLLPQIHQPTLVLHRIADPIIPMSAGQKFAAGIPGARFVPLEGKGHLFCLGDYTRILSAVDDFLGDRTAAPVKSAPEASAFRTVLFTDLVGHTEMMQRLGDQAGRNVLREHERITREVLKKYAGTEIKTDGDSFMVSFASVSAAVECAIELQRAFTKYSETGEPLVVRIGLNAGEPIEEDGDLFGATVILASRIAARADGGEILVADTVRGLCSGKGFLFSDRGEFIAKGFEDPIRIYEVRWRS